MKLTMSIVASVALSASAASAQAPARSAAQDVADVSTNVCYLLASGGLVWQPRDVGEEIRQVEAAGLAYGVPQGVLDGLPRAAGVLVNRATLGSRANGDAHVVMAKDGTAPGCRVLLFADEAGQAAAAVEAALVGSGWMRVEAFTDTMGVAERRLFIRFDANGRGYGLHLYFSHDRSAPAPALFTTVERMDGISWPAAGGSRR